MIASGAPAWAVWLALGLWAVAISSICLAVLMARAQWRKLKPTVLPMLQALGFAPLPMPQPDPRGSVVVDELVSVSPVDAAPIPVDELSKIYDREVNGSE